MKVFRKYTTYEDLRDLYQKCVPVIAVQESKLQEMRNEVARQTEILMRFDELLSIKTDKSAFESLKRQFSTEYVMNTQIEGFKFEIAAQGKET